MAAAKRKKKAKSKPPPPARALQYKVVELSNVDERSLERAVNEWVPQGWSFDGVQFAMRESSKRPSMAFVFFTREGAPLPEPQLYGDDAFRTDHEAQDHLRRLARAEVAAPTSTDAWARLQVLAGEDEEGNT